MLSPKAIKIVSAVTTIAGLAIGLVSDKIGEEKLKLEIQEQVNEAIANLNDGIES